MSANPTDDPTIDDQAVAMEGGEIDDEGLQEPIELTLDVDIDSPSACERHVTVTVSREDIDRYFDDAFSEMMPSAAVPGFRIGRAPRKIVENRFRKDVSSQIKGTLLMDALEQISASGKFAAISEPELDLEAVEVPEDGPMTFEFDIEVRPEFDLPKWKGLEIVRPVQEFSDEDIQKQMVSMLTRYAQMVPSDAPAGEDKYVTLNITSRDGDEVLQRADDEMIRVRPVLSFEDCRVEDFGKLVEGKRPGDKFTAKATISADAENEPVRGKEIDIEFELLEVKELKLPELTPELLDEIGDYASEEELREGIRQNLQRQLEYRQQQKARQQITELLVESADWDLPPGLLKRQSRREMERAIMELRRSGFSESDIRARGNEIRQNSAANTGTALKEHFILERIAEEESIDVGDGDYEREIFLMSLQSGESPRRVRAQLEKRGLMDVLRNQIVERKVLELVQSEAKFKDEKFEPPKNDVEGLSIAMGGDAEIPELTEAKPDEDKKAEAAAE